MKIITIIITIIIIIMISVCVCVLVVVLVSVRLCFTVMSRLETRLRPLSDSGCCYIIIIQYLAASVVV